ncbi:MAG: Snf7 family protein [Candidatus Odinarchaeia archaeon]
MFRRLISWLRGPKLEDVISNLDLLCRRLDYEKRGLEKEATRNWLRAKKERINGSEAAAKTYITHYLQFQKQAFEMDKYRLTINSFIVKLKQAKAVNDLSRILHTAKHTLEYLKGGIKLPNLNETISSINNLLNQFSVSKEVTETELTKISGTPSIKEEDINKALSELDQEIAVEKEEALPIPDEKISELEKEIKRVREGES